jgi:hypothetical protein
MHSPFAAAKYQTHKQPYHTGGSLEFVSPPHIAMPRLLIKCSCDDATSSSATHGSVSTTGINRYRAPAHCTNTSPTSKSNCIGDNGDDETSAFRSSKESSEIPHIERKTLSTNHGSCESRPYCLDRFVRDIDPREKVRLGQFEGTAHARTREECSKGVKKPQKDVGGQGQTLTTRKGEKRKKK